MAFNHVLTETIKLVAGGRILQQPKTTTCSADGEDSREVTIADSGTDVEVDVAIDISQLQSIYIMSSRTVTLETNNGAAPDDTISLIAGKPFTWQADSYHANPFTADVTAFFFTNASGDAAIVDMEILVDTTV